MNINDIETGITRYLQANFPSWNVVKALQNQPKMSGKEISFYIENIENPGDDVWTDANETTGSVSYVGTRNLPLSLVFTGIGSVQSASNFLDIVRMEESVDVMKGYGFTHVTGTQPTRIPELRGTKYVERCEMEWTIRTTSQYASDPGRIEQGSIDGQVEDITFDIEYSI